MLNIDERVWATALAAVFLKRHMQWQLELRDGLLEKATEFLEASAVDLDELFRHAEELIT